MNDDRAREYLARAEEARKIAAQARYAELQEGFLRVAEERERMAMQVTKRLREAAT